MFSTETLAARRSSLFLAGLVLISLYVGRSLTASSTACYGGGILITVLYTNQNNSLDAEIGFNTSYPFLKLHNGTLVTNYSWVDHDLFGAEMNFTELQRDPLKNLSVVTNSSVVGVEYSCNITTLNCTVRCLNGSEEDGLTFGSESGGGFCGNGFGLELLRNSPNLTERWIGVCDNLTTEQILDEADVHIGLSDHNETIACEFNTTVPIHYNVTLWKGGLNATTRPCHQDPTSLLVLCHVEANITNIVNVSDIVCTVWSHWPVKINGYQYTDDDGDYYYEYSGDDDSNSPQAYAVHQTRFGDEHPDGNAPVTTVDGGGGSSVTVVVVLAGVALVAVFVGLMLRRRRARTPGNEQVVYQPQFRPPYQQTA